MRWAGPHGPHHVLRRRRHGPRIAADAADVPAAQPLLQHLPAKRGAAKHRRQHCTDVGCGTAHAQAIKAAAAN